MIRLGSTVNGGGGEYIMSNNSFKICEQTLLLLAMEKFETILIFSIVYGSILYLTSLFLDGMILLSVAIIILGLIGIIYNITRLYFARNYKKFGHEIPVKILKSCIGRARSVDYGDYIYFPVIEYEYILDGKRIKSNDVYWDFDSFLHSRGLIGGLTEKESMSHANTILTELVNNKLAYHMNTYFNQVYMDIYLSPNRKKYFYNQIAFSIVLIVVSCYFLFKH